VEGSREIAGRVEGMLVSFEEHLFGVFAGAVFGWKPPQPHTHKSNTISGRPV
jgi:hypothetical protein